jgi:hypothetical protein
MVVDHGVRKKVERGAGPHGGLIGDDPCASEKFVQSPIFEQRVLKFSSENQLIFQWGLSVPSHKD